MFRTRDPPPQVGAAVTAALANGYKHIDCASVYGNEKEVGAALAAAFADGGVAKREDVFITSKAWNSEHAPKDVRTACEQTLADLQLSYLDLFLVHWPQAFVKVEGTHIGFPKNEDGSMRYDTATTLAETWAAMQELVDAGLVRHVGLSNFTSAQIAAICASARIQPAVLQVESHPFFQQKNLVNAATSHGLVVTAYSPLGSGATIDGHNVPTHPKLAEIGAQYGKSAAQVALRFQVQRGVVTIPKSTKVERIQQNGAVHDFSLSDADLAAIDALDSNKRVGWGGPLVDRGDAGKRPRDEPLGEGGHPNYPFRMLPDGTNDASVF